MKLTKWLFRCLAYALPLSLSAQSIHLSAYIPDSQTVFINGKLIHAKELKGKPTVIELFTSTCIVCFKMLPTVDKLEKEYEGKVQFLLIGNDKAKLPQIFSRFKSKLGLHLDAVFDSSIFNKFQPEFVPNYIWVDENGIVQGKSGPDLLNSQTLLQFVQGDYSFLSVKKVKRNFKNSDLLMSSGVFYRSFFSAPIDSLYIYMPSTFSISSATPYFQTINVSLADLYRYAHFKKAYWNEKDSLYALSWREPIFDSGNDKIDLSRQVCYSLYLDFDKPPEILKKILRNDLENVFGYVTELEEKYMPYWSIEVDKSATLQSKSVNTVREFSYDGVCYKHVQMSELIRLLEYQCKSDTPFVDETGIDYPVDFCFRALMTNLEDVRKSLRSLGISISQKYKVMKVIVLRSNKKVAAKE